MKIERLTKFYKAAISLYNIDQSLESKKLFNTGFIYGLAEKVYVGACAAATTKAYPGDGSWTSDIVYNISNIFGLYIHVLPTYKSDGSLLFVEFWMFKYPMYMDLLIANPNDNVIRAELCGYNPEGIEPDFKIVE